MCRCLGSGWWQIQPLVAHFIACRVLTEWRGWALMSFPLLISTIGFHHERPTLTISPNTNSLPKAHLQIASHWVLKFEYTNLKGHKHLVLCTFLITTLLLSLVGSGPSSLVLWQYQLWRQLSSRESSVVTALPWQLSFFPVQACFLHPPQLLIPKTDSKNLPAQSVFAGESDLKHCL